MDGPRESRKDGPGDRRTVRDALVERLRDRSYARAFERWLLDLVATAARVELGRRGRGLGQPHRAPSGPPEGRTRHSRTRPAA